MFAQCGYIVGLGTDNVGIFYGQLEHFTAIWYIFSHVVYFLPFWYIISRKIWQPWPLVPDDVVARENDPTGVLKQNRRQLRS
jgi:hypothetical protein